MKTGIKLAVGLALVALAAGTSQAATLYWDPNTTTAGFGTATSTGIWGSNGFWTADSTGAFGGTPVTNTTSADNLRIPAANFTQTN